VGFKVFGVNTYDGKANPAQWLTLYEIVVKAMGRDKDIMANYLPIMLNQSAKQQASQPTEELHPILGRPQESLH